MLSIAHAAVRTKIILGFAAILGGMAFAGGLAVWTIVSSNFGFADYRALAAEADAVATLESQLLEARSAVQAHLLDPAAHPLAQAVGEAREADAAADAALRAATGLDAGRRVERVKADLASWLEALEAMKAAGASGEGARTARRVHDESLYPLATRLAQQVDALREDVAAHELALGPALVRSNQIMLVWVGLASAALVALCLFVARGTTMGIGTPLSALGRAVDAMSRGDFSERVTTAARDEFGKLADELNRMAVDVSEALRSIQRGSTDLSDSSARLSSTSEQLRGASRRTADDSTAAVGLTERVVERLDAIADGVSRVAGTATRVASSSADTRCAMEEAAEAVGDVSASMASVASAVEQMSASIAEVSANARTSRDMTGDARRLAREAVEKVGLLDEHSDQIGRVTDVIKNLAAQTNLLALNAHIEAASAGAAGRGFAVVANEVKQLALQSGRAADDIAARIADAQGAARASAEALGGVTDFVDRLAAAVESIAAAVEQQSSVAGQIAADVARAADDTSGITERVGRVAEGVREVASAMDELERLAHHMSGDSREAVSHAQQVAGALAAVRTVAGESDAGSEEVSAAAASLSTLAADLRGRVERFRLAAAG